MTNAIDWDAVKEQAHKELSGSAYDVIADLLEFAETATTVEELLDHLSDGDWVEFHGFDDADRWEEALDEAYCFIQELAK